MAEGNVAYAHDMSALVIITGASSGLGLALARAVPFPARVVDVSRGGPPEDDDIAHFTADLSRPDDWDEVGREIDDLLTRLRPNRVVFIHAAGTLTPIGFAGEVDTRAYRSNVLLNSAAGQVLGHLLLTAIRGLEVTADLVMITSGAASKAYAGWSSYGAGKAALDQWVRTVGIEQAARGDVTVSSIAPGVLATSMQAEIRETSERDFPTVESFRGLLENDELVEPEDAARRIWRLIERGVDTGSVLDIREIQ